MTQKLIVVVAVARNGVIGVENRIPWRVPTDLKRFKELTWGKPLIIGRRTWQSLERPLPNRNIVVVSRDPSFTAAGAHIAQNTREALATARRIASSTGAKEIVIGGGTDVYNDFMDEIDVIYLTEIELEPRGEAFFPKLDPEKWIETAREIPPRGPRDEADFSFVTLERRRG